MLLPLHCEAIDSRLSMLDRSNELIQSLVARDLRVYLICPNSVWARDRMVQAADLFPRGVSILTWETFFANQWMLWGDGRAVVSVALRRKLLTVAGGWRETLSVDGIIAEAGSDSLPRFRGELKPSFVREMSDCLDAAACCGCWEDVFNDSVGSKSGNNSSILAFSDSERAVMNIFARYFEQLKALGLIDRVEREYLLSQRTLGKGAIIMEGLEAGGTRQQAVREALGAHNDVWVLFDAGKPSALPGHSPELIQLARQLYTKGSGIAATGAVVAGEAIGPRATPALVSGLVSKALQGGHVPDDIAVVLPQVAKAQPQIFSELALAGIPFCSTFAVPLNQTQLGSVLLAAFELAQEAGDSGMGDRRDFELLSVLVLSPYLSQHDASVAWDMQREWRGDRSLGHAQRLAMASEKLGPLLGEILQLASEAITEPLIANLTQCLNQMLAIAAATSRRTQANLNDDAASARAIIDYLTELLPANTRCSASELEQVRVTLSRSLSIAEVNGADANGAEASSAEANGATTPAEVSGASGTDANTSAEMNGIKLITPHQLGLQTYPVVIMGDLVAVDYPMSEKPSSLSSLMGKLGATPVRDLAARQRALLLHCIEAATDRFLFYRETHGVEGEELRQSALWDELMASYQDAEDFDSLPVTKPERIPPALEPFALRIYEGNWLREQAASLSVTGYRHFKRGVLDICDIRDGIEGAGSVCGAGSVSGVGEAGGLPTADGLPAAASLSAADGLPAAARLLTEPLSVTALERYLQCPYAWFIDKRLNAAPIDAALDSASLGSFVHAVLNTLYKRILANGMGRVTIQNLCEVLALLDRIYKDTQQRFADEGRQLAVSATDQVALDALLPDIQSLIRRDATFLPGFEPRYLEARVGPDTSPPVDFATNHATNPPAGHATNPPANHATNLTYAGVKVKGIIDRIDVNEQGQAVIIDYKMSGNLSEYGLRSKGEEFPTAVQGAIYARLAERAFGITPVGSLYRSYKKASTRGVYASPLVATSGGQAHKVQGMSAHDAIPAPDYAHYLDTVEEQAASALARLRRGDIAPNPSAPSVCKYCVVAQDCSKRGGR